MLGVGHFCPTVLRVAWTQLHQTCQGDTAIMTTREICFRAMLLPGSSTDHVTSAAIDLHWLPAAEARIQYILYCTVQYCWYTMLSPRQHQRMLSIFFNLSPSRHSVLRSASTGCLFVSCTRLLSGFPSRYSQDFESTASRRPL